MAGGIPAPTVAALRELWLSRNWAGLHEKLDTEAEIDAFLAPLAGDQRHWFDAWTDQCSENQVILGALLKIQSWHIGAQLSGQLPLSWDSFLTEALAEGLQGGSVGP